MEPRIANDRFCRFLERTLMAQRNAAARGRNIRFTSLLTMGESWHNNHHAFPGSARLGLFVGEWDPGWCMLMVPSKLGLVWAIGCQQRFPSVPNRGLATASVPSRSITTAGEAFDVA